MSDESSETRIAQLESAVSKLAEQNGSLLNLLSDLFAYVENNNVIQIGTHLAILKLISQTPFFYHFRLRQPTDELITKGQAAVQNSNLLLQKAAEDLKMLKDQSATTAAQPAS
jgi:hypothetical protein